MRVSLLTVLVLLLSFQIGTAQQARSKRYKAPKAGQIDLSTVNDKYNVRIGPKEAPEPESKADEIKMNAIKAYNKSRFPRKITQIQSSTARTTSVDTPIVLLKFQTDTFSGIPPDNSAAASNENRMIAVMNDMFTVYDPYNDSFIHQISLEAFSRTTGLGSSLTNYRYDPKVIYDPNADRFICIMLNGTDQYNDIVLSFSQTNDPNGTWNFYVFPGNFANDTTWFDYPAIAITQDEVFFTGNKVKFDSTWQAGFKESVIYQVRKTDGYSGATSVTYRIFDSITYNGDYLRCLYPLNPADTILGPAQYLLSNKDFDTLNDSVFIVQIPDTIGAPDSILSVTAVASSLAYGMPPDALQPDTATGLATNDNRILGGFIKDQEIQFVCTSIDPANGASAIYHGIISNFNTAPTATGNFYTIDTLDFGYPNISYTGNSGSGYNQSIISFDYSGANLAPSYGAIFYDGSSYSNIVTIRSGQSYIDELSGNLQRWGDYSGSHPFYGSIGKVWVEGLYGRWNHNYGNYFAELASPYYNSKVPTVSPARTANGMLYPNPAREMVRFEFTIGTRQNYRFLISELQGRIIDQIANKVCEPGENVIQFNTASLAPGTYFLQAVGDDGGPIAIHQFVKN